MGFINFVHMYVGLSEISVSRKIDGLSHVFLSHN